MDRTATHEGVEHPRSGVPAMWLANANAAIWAVGNGLVSTLLVVYLAADLGAKGLAVSLILAAPRFAGLLRLAVPAIMARLHSRKAVCIAGYLLSSVVLCAVPTVAAMKGRTNESVAISTLVAAWCLYHVAEYVGTVTLWSWLGDLTPRNVRGNLLGRREFWLTAGRLVGLAASASLASLWTFRIPSAAKWEPLALSAAAGALMMAVAVVPLMFMPSMRQAPSATPQAPWRTLGRALTDPAYSRLLLFAFWFSIANGITAAAQEVYPIRVLDISYTARQLLQGMMRTGQLAITRWVGRLVDLFGNRPVMIVSQVIVSAGPLFFLFASRTHPWLVAGAYVVWIAYAGLNVGLDNIKLKLAPSDNNAPFVAIYHAVADLANGIATVGGGVIYDYITSPGVDPMPLYVQHFIAGWIARVLAIPLLVWLIEPGARRVREML